jgi:hypothetical protein
MTVAPAGNTEAWAVARTETNSQYVKVIPTPAAREILSDPHWAAKMKRALAESDAGEGVTLDQYLEKHQ